MSATEVRDRLGDRFRLLTGPEYGPDRQPTLRHAVAWSYDLLDDDERAVLRHGVGVRRAASTCRRCARSPETSDDIEVLRLLDSLVRKSLGRRPPRLRADALQPVRDDPHVRRRAAGRGRASATRCATGMPLTSPSEAARPLGAVERSRLARRRSTGCRRSWPTCGRRSGGASTAVSSTVATDVAAHAALMGFSVELFETDRLGRGAARRGRPRPTYAGSRGSTPPRATPASSARGRGRDRARPPRHRAGGRPGYESCEPGYATFIEALGQVYCGNLDRYVELTREVAALPGSGRAYGDRRVRRRAAVGRAGSRRRWSSPRRRWRRRASSATRTGSPTRCGSSGWPARRRTRSARWRPGTRASPTSREHDVRFFEGFMARDAALLHTSDGQLETALTLFDTSIEAFLRSGAVAQLIITLASLPALFERLDRPAVARHPARRDGPRAGELPPRPVARRARRAAAATRSARRRRTRCAATGGGDGPPRGRGVRRPPDRRRPAGARGRAAATAARPA